jgi:hypothetical protein
MEEKVEEGTGGEGAARRLDASEVNRLAQELDDATINQREVAWESDTAASPADGGAQPVGATAAGSVDDAPSPDAAVVGGDALGAEEGEKGVHLFPPDVAPGVEIGGTPEEQGVLRDEYTEG